MAAYYQILFIILLNIHIKCKYGHDNKNCKTCGIKYKDWECCLEYTNGKYDLIE